MKSPTNETPCKRHRVAALMVTVLAATLACDGTAVSPDRGAQVAPGAPVLARSPEFSPWSAPARVDTTPGTHSNFNTPQNDGCPFISRDGKTFYMASTRGGGSLDIWVSTRASENDGWGEPVNVGAPINSAADDFCPTMDRDGHLLYFASRRSGGCGGSDLYVARLRADKGFDPPELLPCDTTYAAVNSPRDEWGPFPLPEAGSGPVLYFSSFRPGGFAAEAAGAAVDSDIYRSESHGGVYGVAKLVPGVNTAADDGQPNVRRDGLELFFYSTRDIPGVSQGFADLYVATRASVFESWSSPANLGAGVNGGAAETRPSLSWDGTTLYFGSTRPGKGAGADIYVTTRHKLRGGN